MRITLCDCCGEEIKENHRVYSLNYLCHLDKENRDKMGYVRLTAGEAIPVSGRYEEKDLCLKCYNRITIKAVLEFESLKENK
jgi:hypothetical protein